MTITSANPTPVQNHHPIRKQISSDVQTLESALESGDLQSAQTSFADLQKLLQGSGAIAAASTASSRATTSPASAGTASFLQAFQTLGQDLSSGNLANSQKDFAQLQTDATQQIQAGGHQHHHHHHLGTTPPEPLTPAPATVADSTPAAQTNEQAALAATLV